MSKWFLAAGAAAIALATPVLADPGGNKGKGGDDRGPKAAKVERGGGQGGGQVQVARAERPGKGSARLEARGPSGDRASGKSLGKSLDKSADRGPELRGKDRQATNGRDYDRDSLRDRDDVFFARNDNARDGRGLVNGCPPGLDKKNNDCLPPGQARKLVGSILPAAFGANMLDGPFRQWYQDNDQYTFRNDGDYIYRVNRQGGLIDALFPIQNRDYNYYDVGSAYPADYNFYNVPQQYQSFYADGNDYNYRYGDGAIYQVDRSNNMISSIVALLAGDLGVGQQLPNTYSTYNVPMAYRDRYYDTPDAQYRYNDGFIYRADPKTQLITAVIDALV